MNYGLIPKVGVTNTKVLENIEAYIYSSCIRRFIKKARDWRAKRYWGQPPRIVILGDSVTNATWVDAFKYYLCNAYNIPLPFCEIHRYGGQSIEYMLPFIDDILIHSNPDLVIFGEREGGYLDELLVSIEDVIALIRERTTADIAMTTWSMWYTAAEAYLDDSDSLKDNYEYQQFNWYRDIASTYNCELIDFNQAIKTALDKKIITIDDWVSGPHLDDTGYEKVFLPEIKKHFPESDDQESINMPYPLRGKEEMINLQRAVKFDLFNNFEQITATGDWAITDENTISTSTVDDTLEIELEDAIGVEIYHGETANADITIKPEDGSYVSPSTLTYNSMPLQYCTEVLSVTDMESPSTWVTKRPFKKGIVTANILDDGRVKSGRYTIVVNSVSGETTSQETTCEMFDPDETSLGTFTAGEAFSYGNLSFPVTYNGNDNYSLDTTFVEGDVYEFYVINNWCDTLATEESPDFTAGIAPSTISNNGSSLNSAEYDEETGICTFIIAATGVTPPVLQWTGRFGEHDYLDGEERDLLVIYDEIYRDGDINPLLLGSSDYTLSESGVYLISGQSLSNFKMNTSVWNTGEVQFRLSVRAISSYTDVRGVKKIFGLERGNYTLKLTVTSGGADIKAIKILH